MSRTRRDELAAKRKAHLRRVAADNKGRAKRVKIIHQRKRGRAM